QLVVVQQVSGIETEAQDAERSFLRDERDRGERRALALHRLELGKPRVAVRLRRYNERFAGTHDIGSGELRVERQPRVLVSQGSELATVDVHESLARFSPSP